MAIGKNQSGLWSRDEYLKEDGRGSKQAGKCALSYNLYFIINLLTRK